MQNYVYSHIKISTFTIFQYTELSLDVDFATDTYIQPAGDTYFAAIYFF